MKSNGLLTAVFALLAVSLVHAEEVVATGATVQHLAGGFRFTEGPAPDKEGNVYFTDIPNNRIHIWSVNGERLTFLENSRGANGLAFDKEGNLIACAGATGQILSIGPAGEITVLAEDYQGRPFNSPNDLWIDPQGGIYFSDPRYGQRSSLPQEGEHVYYLPPNSRRAIRVIGDMIRPNGLIGTSDGKLYVADHGADQTFVYNINSDGTLHGKKLFASQGSDGITLDSRGNVYLTADSVTVYTPGGQLIQTIAVPEKPSNVCFGGKDNKTLFITARTSLYAIDMQVAGLK
jgi:gluconolactonase